MKLQYVEITSNTNETKIDKTKVAAVTEWKGSKRNLGYRHLDSNLSLKVQHTFLEFKI